MLSETVSFVVSPRADLTIQLGIAEPAGLGITGNPIFLNRKALELALELSGLSSKMASEIGFRPAIRVSFIQLVSLGFF